MDPTTCVSEMLASLGRGRAGLEDAIERAHALKGWLAHGGFAPKQPAKTWRKQFEKLLRGEVS